MFSGRIVYVFRLLHPGVQFQHFLLLGWYGHDQTLHKHKLRSWRGTHLYRVIVLGLVAPVLDVLEEFMRKITYSNQPQIAVSWTRRSTSVHVAFPQTVCTKIYLTLEPIFISCCRNQPEVSLRVLVRSLDFHTPRCNHGPVLRMTYLHRSVTTFLPPTPSLVSFLTGFDRKFCYF